MLIRSPILIYLPTAPNMYSKGVFYMPTQRLSHDLVHFFNFTTIYPINFKFPLIQDKNQFCFNFVPFLTQVSHEEITKSRSNSVRQNQFPRQPTQKSISLHL